MYRYLIRHICEIVHLDDHLKAVEVLNAMEQMETNENLGR